MLWLILGLGAALGDSASDTVTKFSVLLGGLWLKERPLLPRFLGAVLMCSGAILIALKGT
jgi:uncharacterized membrane protein